MKSLFVFIALISIAVGCQVKSEVPSSSSQIQTAVLAAPAEFRDKATVYGYDKDGEFGVLRTGSNMMICLADDPAKDGFSVAAYHKDLDPFMARGRELKKAGKSYEEITEIRENEVQKSIFKMPDNPTTLFILNAKEEQVNWEKGEVTDGAYRAVVYIPYATAESTGLPLSPMADGMPWIMDPGTHKAHIMITPPRE